MSYIRYLVPMVLIKLSISAVRLAFTDKVVWLVYNIVSAMSVTSIGAAIFA